MKSAFLLTLSGLSVPTIPSDRLAEYLYALECCKFASSACSSVFNNEVLARCTSKINEIKMRPGAKNLSSSIIIGKATDKELECLSVSDLIGLHSQAHMLTKTRHAKKLETFTRVFQWRTVKALLQIDENSPLAQILLLAECLEASNYARILGLPYAIGQQPELFSPALLSEDQLIEHISRLSAERSYMARESLIAIADYIQEEIADKDLADMHIPLLNAILNTKMPRFAYPNIAKALEKATNNLSKTNSMTDIELAPSYYTLWTVTLKQSYYTRFSKTLRQCYLSLTKDKSYPNLGLNSANPKSIDSAINLLNKHRQNLWIINDRYNIDEIINKYHPCNPHALCTQNA